MRVLFLTHYSDLYGANISMIELAEDMINRYGIHVSIICPRKGRIISKAKEIGADVKCYYYFTWQAHKFSYIKKILRYLINPILLRIICKYVRSFSPDIIHSNSSVVDLGSELSRRLDIPCVWHLREFSKEHFGFKCLVPLSKEHEYYNRANAIIAVSDALRNNYLSKYPELEIVTVYDGVKPFSTIKTKHEKLNFCIVGRICENKGQINIIKAIALLPKERRNEFCLHIIGEGEKQYINFLKVTIEKNNMKNNVVFHGYSSCVGKMLNYMDVGIMASKYEAFGRVTVEYMLAGMYVIATDSGGTREILGNDALYFDSDDIGKLVVHLEFCLNNKGLIEKLGCVMKKKAEEKFVQRVCTDNVIEVYKGAGIYSN